MQFTTLLSLLALIYLSSAQRSLPLPARDIPSNLNPPLKQGRVDVHGWLWLPWDTPTHGVQAKTLKGYFYHHTPEFWTNSPHDFEIMAAAELFLDNAVEGLPIPPKSQLVGTEYVFTPPAFSLDLFITGKVPNYYGKFTNGSFDTHQRYLLSNGHLTVTELITVKYLEQNATAGYSELPYYSYPRNPTVATTSLEGTEVHLYFLHLLEQSPDFDQIVHVTVDPSSCNWRGGDSFTDLVAPGATFVVPNSNNNVYERLSASTAPLVVNLMTDATRNSEHTQCSMIVVEEIHCVVVPNSFDNCPTVRKI